MAISPSELQDNFIRERDNQLAEWFAEGLLDDEVLDRADACGYDLSIEGVANKRTELHERTNAALARIGPKRFQQIARSHQSVRVRELDLLAETLRKAIQWCHDHEKYSALPKLSDSYMRCLRSIAEEVHDLEPAAKGMNVWLTMVQNVPPAERRDMVLKMQELRSMLDAKMQLGLGTGSDTIIDGGAISP